MNPDSICIHWKHLPKNSKSGSMLHISMTTAHYKLEEDRLIANLARDTSVNIYKPHIRTTLQCVAQEICLLASSSTQVPFPPHLPSHFSSSSFFIHSWQISHADPSLVAFLRAGISVYISKQSNNFVWALFCTRCFIWQIMGRFDQPTASARPPFSLWLREPQCPYPPSKFVNDCQTNSSVWLMM